MGKLIDKIVNYFEEQITENWRSKVPVEIIELLNDLDNPKRRELRDRLFNVAKFQPKKLQTADALEWLHHCFLVIDEFTFRMHQVYFSPGYDILDNLRDLLLQAKVKIEICVFSITDDRLARAIRHAMDRGVKVRIITDDLKTLDRGSKIKWLDEVGIEVKMDQSRAHMHHKFGIIDHRIAFTGSFNWTKSATRSNNENVLVTTNHSIVNQFSEEFERLWLEMHKY